MPSTGSQQTTGLQEELEERRKREQEELAEQAAKLAAAQQQQAAALQGQEQPITPAAVNTAGAQPASTTPATYNDEGSDGVQVDRTVSTAKAAAYKDVEKAAEDAAKANADANANYQNFLGKVIEGYQNELREAKKEAELQKQIDTNKNVFAGVTEFAGALVNLIGTSKGAVNQQPRTVTQDWMREADQHRLQERERLERMRDKLRQQEMAGENARYQMTKEQIAEQLNLKKLKGANAIDLEQTRQAEKNEAYERSRNAVTDALAAKRIEAQMRGQDVELAAIKQRYNADETRFNIELLKQGLVPDGNGGFVFEPALAAKKMGAQALEIPAYGERNAVVMYIHPNSLKNTILSYAQDEQVKKELAAAGFDLDAIVNQLKGANGDIFTERKLSGTDLQTQIQTAAMYSPTLVEALRRVSINSYNIGEQQQQEPVQTQPAWAQPNQGGQSAQGTQKNEIKTDKDGFPVAG
ncbi:MAG: hypothetical protein J5732_00775 [Bacteroidaceae bacterium]|nr:hypothetical protein [Bacteroidaceae bacterium]